MHVVRSNTFCGSTVLIVFLLANTVLCLVNNNPPPTTDCQLIRRSYLSMNLPMEDISLKGNELQICSKSSKCCSEAMEKKLSEKANHEALQIFKDVCLRNDLYLKSRIKSFEGVFQSLFKFSFNQLNTKFTRSYGYIYEEIKALVTILFAELQDYHPGRFSRIKPVLERFFHRLFLKMFVLINRRYKFNADYLNCTESKIAQLNPFGDKANLLISQLTRALVTTRTYVQSLQAAKAIISGVSNQVALNSQCQSSLLKLRFCNLCAEQIDVLPCADFCHQVISDCFYQHALIQPYWTKFVDTLARTAETVTGPFNLKVILKQLEYTISDAIMAFKKTNDGFLEKIHQDCSKTLVVRTGTNPTRRKRQIKNVPPAGRRARKPKRKMNFGWRYKSRKDGHDAMSGDLGRLVTETKTSLQKMKNLWGPFASQKLCSVQRVASANQRCWNGSATHSYNAPKVNMPSLLTAIDPIVNNSIELLKLATGNLEKASKGEEVDYIESSIFNNYNKKKTNNSSSTMVDSNEMDDGSGSGSILELPKSTLTTPLAKYFPTTSRSLIDVDDTEELGSGEPKAAAKSTLTSTTLVSLVNMKAFVTTNTLEKRATARPPDEEIEEENGSGDAKSVIPSVKSPFKEGDDSQSKVDVSDSNLWPKEKSGKGDSEIRVGSGSVVESVKVVNNEPPKCQPPKCSSASTIYPNCFVRFLMPMAIMFFISQTC